MRATSSSLTRTYGEYTYNIGVVRLQPNAGQQIVSYKDYPAVQFRAAYELSALQDIADYPERLTYFDVHAPFDLAASISDEPHPVLAVLNNIITRGLATNTSPLVERAFCTDRYPVTETSGDGVIKFDVAGSDGTHDVQALEVALRQRDSLSLGLHIPYNEMAYTPLAIARIQKLLVEVLLSGRLNWEQEEWNILVEEEDVPCAALAFEDFRQMFQTLTSMSVEFEHMALPTINLTVISNDSYNDSPLHLGEYHLAKATDEIRNSEYDLVIHYSTSVKKGYYDFNSFKARNNCHFAVFAANEDNMKAQRFVYTTDRINYRPFVSRDGQGSYVEDEAQVGRLTYFLNLLFRKQKFRNGQLPILTRALSNLPVIGLLPTGSGKSLTYQLAAMLQPGITIVIDPLISLMKDQYDGLLHNGIDSCTFINSTVENKQQREEMMERSKVQFVFLSPERLCILSFRNRLRDMQQLRVYFAYGVIDEVHCVSEWGHDFRFTYLHLGRNLYNYVLPKQRDGETPHVTLFGLTATASFDVLADVERELSGNGAFRLDSEATVRYENTNRLELQYHVVPVDATSCANKWDVYKKKNNTLPSIVENGFRELQELQKPENIARIKQRFVEREATTDRHILKEIQQADLSVEMSGDWYEESPNKASAIVFCPHRRGSIGVNETYYNYGIADAMGQKFGYRFVSKYVGGDTLVEQDRFLTGKTSVMVATKAFGMGIDKPNVRLTYNVCFSSSLEAFVQEAGRAGRDRKMALATILYCSKQFMEKNPRTLQMESVAVDYGVHKFFYDNNFIGEDFEKKIMHYLLTQGVTDVTDDDHSGSGQNNHRKVAGFMDELLSTREGNSLESYISYSPDINQQSIDKVNEWLRKRHYPVLVIKDDSRDLKDGEVDFVATIEKAIYRMCCVGIIDDYTRDYQNRQFRIVTKRRSDDDYFRHLKLFLMRYYTDERADVEMRKAYEYRGDNAMQKCLGYITEFVYNKIAKKRERAISDMESFCQQAVNSKTDWIETNEDLKDFIYFYFNSKFARDNYIAENGEPYSLTADTEHGKRSSYDILFKYMNVVDDDIVGSSGSPKDNIKHLQGAVRLIRRSLTDSNPALDLLNVFCLLYLNVQDNKNLQEETRNSFKNGYKEFKARTTGYQDFYDKMELFTQRLLEKGAVTTDQLEPLEKWKLEVEAELQLDWLKEFKKQYTR